MPRERGPIPKPRTCKDCGAVYSSRKNSVCPKCGSKFFVKPEADLMYISRKPLKSGGKIGKK